MTEPNISTRELRAGASRESAEAVAQGIDARGACSAPTISAADLCRDDLTGYCLGQYALGAKIGGGGMGKVYHARHLHLDRAMAIKFVATNMSASKVAQMRFEQEARALGQLQHPQIVNAVDAGCHCGLKFLVTEYIEGEDLARLVGRRGPLPAMEACELIRQSAAGLSYLHSENFIHRDIKPSNLIVDSSGTLKILDFGLVHGGAVDFQLTGAGATIGTLDFIAPEQAHDSSQVDHRCDLYSLGCTLLFLLSGQLPFADEKYSTPAAKLKGHLFDTPVWLERPPASIPHALLDILRKLLAKSPGDRFQSAADVEADLSRFVLASTAPRPDVAAAPPLNSGRLRSARLVAGVITLAACIALGAVYERQSEDAEASLAQPSRRAAEKPPVASPEPRDVSEETRANVVTENVRPHSAVTAPEPNVITREATETKSAVPTRMRMTQD
jgi:serine/threonine protein kinase